MTPSSGLARRPESVPAELAESLTGDGKNIFATLSPELIDELAASLIPRAGRAYRTISCTFTPGWRPWRLAALNKSVVETYPVESI